MDLSRSVSYGKRLACSLRRRLILSNVTNDIVLIGGGSSVRDHAELIDKAAIVVRFNNCKSSGWRYGYRTDFLFINNTGPGALKYCRVNSLGTPFPFTAPQQYFFSRDIDTHLAQFKRVTSHFPLYGEGVLEDHSAQIATANRLPSHKLSWVPQGFSQFLFQKLTELAREPFLCPSTGMIGLAWILMNERFLHQRIHLLGFSFRGWEGHPWDAERELVLQQVSLGRCLLHDL